MSDLTNACLDLFFLFHVIFVIDAGSYQIEQVSDMSLSEVHIKHW